MLHLRLMMVYVLVFQGLCLRVSGLVASSEDWAGMAVEVLVLSFALRPVMMWAF